MSSVCSARERSGTENKENPLLISIQLLFQSNRPFNPIVLTSYSLKSPNVLPVQPSFQFNLPSSLTVIPLQLSFQSNRPSSLTVLTSYIPKSPNVLQIPPFFQSNHSLSLTFLPVQQSFQSERPKSPTVQTVLPLQLNLQSNCSHSLTVQLY